MKRHHLIQSVSRVHLISFAKLSVLISLMSFTMGNQGCENKQQERVLKMDAEVGYIGARPITLPTGERIDFAFVANTLFSTAVVQSRHFTMVGPVPTPQPASNGTFGFGPTLMKSEASNSPQPSTDGTSANDMRFLIQHGFLKADGTSIHTNENEVPQTETESLADSEAQSTSQKVGEAAVADKDLPACLYNMPQTQLGGAVIGFEAAYGGGLCVGYNCAGSTAGNAGGSIDFSSARLDIQLNATHPLRKEIDVTGAGISHVSSVKFSIGIAPVGLNFFYNSSMRTAVVNAFNDALMDLVNGFSDPNTYGSWQNAWQSRIVYNENVNNDTNFIIRGGVKSGIKPGDQFKVTNLIYNWEDPNRPCGSRLVSTFAKTLTPVAILEVPQGGVSDNVTILQMKQYLIDQRIQPGARVEIHKLAPLTPVAPTVPAKTTTL